MRRWLVAGGLIEREDGQLLLVQNRRRDGTLDWTPPGGVIEAQEEAILDGLTREVAEETGIIVLDWTGPLWRVEATAPAMGWTLQAEVHLAVSWQGEVRVGDDPDGIVVDAGFVAVDECRRRLTGSARWVCEPIAAWLAGTVEPLWRYRLDGQLPGPVVVTRL